MAASTSQLAATPAPTKPNPTSAWQKLEVRHPSRVAGSGRIVYDATGGANKLQDPRVSLLYNSGKDVKVGGDVTQKVYVPPGTYVPRMLHTANADNMTTYQFKEDFALKAGHGYGPMLIAPESTLDYQDTGYFDGYGCARVAGVTDFDLMYEKPLIKESEVVQAHLDRAAKMRQTAVRRAGARSLKKAGTKKPKAAPKKSLPLLAGDPNLREHLHNLARSKPKKK